VAEASGVEKDEAKTTTDEIVRREGKSGQFQTIGKIIVED
jgi:hypothetical protein